MQYRQLRYFVAVVEAGSISRAALTAHVAQPALSQQIADLEDRIGVKLLHRTPRGVKPTPSGQTFYREASSILARVSRLPELLRETTGTVQGTVRLGLVASLAPYLVGTVIERIRSELPGVNLICSDSDSGTLSARVQGHALDLAVIFEDELITAHVRTPLFEQRLFLIGKDVKKLVPPSVSLAEIADLPLVLPSTQNNRRRMIDKMFAARGFRPRVVAEVDSFSSELSTMRAGVGNLILNTGHLPDAGFEEFAEPLLIEPKLKMVCSIVSNGDASATTAADAVRAIVMDVVKVFIKRAARRGAKLVEA